jgi:hypothetical protein
VLQPSAIRIEASPSDPDRIALNLPGVETALPTHWSFGRLAQLAGAPAGYLRQLPVTLAAINLQWGLADKNDRVQVQTLTDAQGRFTELRAATGPEYGRIPEHLLIAAIRRIAGDGTPVDAYFGRVKRILSERLSLKRQNRYHQSLRRCKITSYIYQKK